MRRGKNLRDPVSILVGAVILLLGLILLISSYVADGTTSSVLHESGLVLVATILVTYCYEFLLRRHHAKVVCEIVANTVVPEAPRYGLNRVIPRLDFKQVFDRLSKNDELLWLDTYCPEQFNFQRCMRQAIERGAKIRMMAIDPNCQNAQNRASEIDPSLGYTYDAFRMEAIANIQHLADSLRSLDVKSREGVDVASLRLRFYTDLPCVPMYLVLHKGWPVRGYTGFYLGDPSFEMPHLEWSRGAESILKSFADYFERKWRENEISEWKLDGLLELGDAMRALETVPSVEDAVSHPPAESASVNSSIVRQTASGPSK